MGELLKSTLGYCERFLNIAGERFDRSKWRLMADILDTLDRRRGCTFLIGGSIQSWKSFAAQLFCLASFVLRSARMAWYGPSGDFVQEFAEEKFNVLYEQLPPNAHLEPSAKNRIKTLSKQFPHMPFSMLSAGTKAARQSKSLEVIVCDEAWMYAEHVKEIFGRLTHYVKSQSYRFILPTSGWTVGDAVDDIWEESDQRVPHLICPHCSEWFYPDVYAPAPIELIDTETGRSRIDQPPGGLRYDTSDEVRDTTGKLNRNRLTATVWYQCPCCAARLDSLPLATAKYIPQNPDPSPDVVAWKWNALLHMPLAFVAWEKATADEALAKGDSGPLEEFDRKRSLRPWSIKRLYKEVDTASCMGNYKLGDEWADEYARFLTIDVQQDHFWWLVRLWSRSTQSRLYACGKAWNRSELRDIQLRYKIPDHGGDIRKGKDNRYYFPKGCGVAIDGNYDPNGIVKDLAAEYHWLILHGIPEAKRFRHKDGQHRIWNEIDAVETFLGRRTEANAKLDRYVATMQYAPSEARSINRNLKATTEPVLMHSYASDVSKECPDYLEHQKAWQPNLKPKNKRTQERVLEWVQVSARDDLEWCERAQTVLASTAGLIGMDATTEDEISE